MSRDKGEIDLDGLMREMGATPPGKKGGATVSEQGDLAKELKALRKQYGELYLLSRAVWELLREKTDLQEADLQAKLGTLQAAQQLATKPKAEPCPECDRPLQRIEGKHYQCIYCGYIQAFQSPFDRLR